ncbi:MULTISPECIES: glycoside hydrolase family 32 protein [Streptomyces]|uniref:beta-fructofuranosidase n=1 Tax=Streptomyces chartreusis NRRL 3882 TaxID=1079985 RepID=A0A2N9BAB1_STRCX|nr:glycoside hydrolase family 32 protein [Streptomyces chartreusis]MYS91201.1 glycosyl hydrolase [Streptomyces sp. SID5464]SOR80295.1 Sucrose-6-phosphate hydrolase [Streptomyces chartreusis NRRL 3882]
MSTAPFDRDRHRPVAHLRPPHNWINDPNGLVHHDGHYHVCYQYNPHGTDHANMHWGHFRSPDLVSWEPLPIALTPTPGGEDADGCFSGNAVSDGDRIVAFYSAHRQERPQHQLITTAISRDGGLTFRPRGDLLIPEPPDGTTMYRDPYVWQDGNTWRMLVGAALADGRAAALLYDSPDLQTWTYRGPFSARAPQPVGDAGLLTGEGWECPQYLPAASGRGALILSGWYERDGPQGVLALIGEDRGDVFEAGPPQLLDHGPDFYAPALLRAPGGRWLLWGWSWEARNKEWSEAEGWAGTLTLPREIELTEDGRMHQRPAAELLALRGERTVHAAGLAAGSAPVDLGEVSRSFDLTARLEATGKTGLRLVTAPDDSEYLDILLDADAGQLVVIRDHASLDPRARGGTYTMPCPSGRPVDLRVVVDRSIAEIFLSTGQVLTVRFYPVGEGPWHLQAHTAPGAQLNYSIDAWQLLPLEIKEYGTDTLNGKGRAA